MSKGPEAQTQKLIMDWLAAKGIMAFRMNSGAVLSTYKGKNRMVRYGVAGMADVLAFPRDTLVLFKGQHGYESIIDRFRPLWIECKALKGKQSELQQSFQKQVEAQGHRYILAYSLDDVLRALGAAQKGDD